MRRYLSPIGFSPHLVTRPVIADGISTGDRVEILRPEQQDEGSEERTRNAIHDVRSTLSSVVNSIELEVTTIETTEFDAAVSRCSEIIVDGQKPVVCLGAGATDIHLPLTIAATAHSDHVVATMVFSDLEQTTREINLPPLTTDFPGRARDTFQSLSELERGEVVALSDLSESSDADRTTVSRHVQALETGGFVRTTREQKQKHVSLTVLGLLFVRNMFQ